MLTVCDSDLQTDGADDRKACLDKFVLLNGWMSDGMTDTHRDSVAHVDRLYVRTDNLYSM